MVIGPSRLCPLGSGGDQLSASLVTWGGCMGPLRALVGLLLEYAHLRPLGVTGLGSMNPEAVVLVGPRRGRLPFRPGCSDPHGCRFLLG